MLRMRKVTDQGFVVLAFFVREAPDGTRTARAVAEATRLPPATAAKVLKALQRAELLDSSRGLQGGYSLSCDPESITVLDVVERLEGRVGLTDCSLPGLIACDAHDTCQIGPAWPKITHAVREALRSVTLLDLVSHGAGASAASPLLTGTG